MAERTVSKYFDFDNSYSQLPEAFYQRVLPTPVNRPELIVFNSALAAELGLRLNGVNDAELAAIFAGNHVPLGAEPIAMAYAGHQFGHFVPQLGDGRAILLGEVHDRNGMRRDIQLKGCGQTPFSRRGDGRAALGPVMREYIVSEAMHALGIKTSRALAAVITGEKVHRETAVPGAILTRVAACHVRIGTFEYFARQDRYEHVRQLADYVLSRLYPDAQAAANPYVALLESIIDAQAALVASWMNVGFIHGVMNTDNMALSGETIDYGPCAFMDHYDPLRVFSSIDRHGRYAFGNQPAIAQWNLARLAETILPLLDSNAGRGLNVAEQLIKSFPARFEIYRLKGMRRKFGFYTQEGSDGELMEDFMTLMHQNSADYTLTFRLLCALADQKDGAASFLTDTPSFSEWLVRWRERLGRQTQTASQCASLMRSANPVYIPHNHRIQQAIEAAVECGDFSVMKRLMSALAEPYRESKEYAEYAIPPLSHERIKETFCGT